MGFLADFASGFMTGLTGRSISFSQNAPSFGLPTRPIAPSPTVGLGFKKYEKWNPKSGISLYYNTNDKKAVAAQQRTHSKLQAQGMQPYIGTTLNNEKIIVWQTPQVAREKIGLIDNFSYSSPMQQTPAPELPKKQVASTSFLKTACKYTSNICKFIYSPFTTIRNWWSGDPTGEKVPQWQKTTTSILDSVGMCAASFLCPPLFFAQVGSLMGGTAIDYAMS